MNSPRSKCTRCHVNLPIDHFKTKRNGDLYKLCIQCTQKDRERPKCQHGKQKYYCKLCGGKGICPHGKRKVVCKDCGGSQICKHQRHKSVCKDCGGSQICKHQRQRSLCKECIGGGICNHQRIRSKCKECGGGSICKHQKYRDACKECDKKSFCKHRKRKNSCKECDPKNHLAGVVRSRIYQALKVEKSKSSIEYLGIDISSFKKHIESKFVEGMNWENYGKVWHIDHIVPLQYENPTIEKVIERLHYTNCQPLWAPENIRKRNRYIG